MSAGNKGIHRCGAREDQHNIDVHVCFEIDADSTDDPRIYGAVERCILNSKFPREVTVIHRHVSLFCWCMCRVNNTEQFKPLIAATCRSSVSSAMVRHHDEWDRFNRSRALAVNGLTV